MDGGKKRGWGGRGKGVGGENFDEGSHGWRRGQLEKIGVGLICSGSAGSNYNCNFFYRGGSDLLQLSRVKLQL